MKLKSLAATVLLLSATLARADNLVSMEAFVSEQTEVNASEVTMSDPLKVTALTLNGLCKFDADIVSLQPGKSTQVGLMGRITGGNCSGKQIKAGVVLPNAAKVEGAAEGRFKLLPSLIVILFVPES